ncbi:hypothetical protein G1C96_0172 [Bifidobacterium sp. DSM 109958]|uniref:Uncharacterized protein n=1 Tax=Bifidobacterium moraviense TaxID=2675323 RepID=A0A7Y0F054_9BIFI|nr:hypothetical protein [Bifidobacterium sp. DSM 109958]NMM99594.1 hypothetical protein [Bifidobacterium sp. DSM 109958]
MRRGLRITSVVMIAAAVAYAVAAGLLFARSSVFDVDKLMFNTPNALITGEDAIVPFGAAFVAAALILAVSGVLGLLASTGENKVLLTVFQAITWVTMVLVLLVVLFNVLAVRTDNLLLLIATAALFGVGADLAQRVKREIRIAEGKRYKGHQPNGGRNGRQGRSK